MTALAALKAHCNITFNDDDALLTAKLETATRFTSQHIGRLDPDTGETVMLTWETAEPELREAVLMLAAHLYENREATAVGSAMAMTPLGFWDLILSYRRWVF